MKLIAFCPNMIIFCEFLKKYRRLVVENKDAQNLVRQLSSCLIEKYSSFTQFLLKYEKKQNKESFLNQLI